MSGTLRFDGKVVIVTGAGGGIGKAYALEFARRGGKVVVNDLGVTTKGEGKDTKAADAVVQEIKAAGGQSVADYNSVVDGAKIVQTALDAFGTVDIVINNAGILRDVSFGKMSDQDWKLIQDVHVNGAYAVTKAAWEHMRKKKFGRILMVTSAAGLYGNHGQANYSAAKLATVGLANTLALEGKKANVHVNTIAPLAGSRMTETVMPPDLVKALKPEYVVPLVLWLCHESCQETGGIYEVGAGWAARLRWERSKGAFLDGSFSVEDVRDKFGAVGDFSEPSYPTSPNDAFGPIMQSLDAQKEKQEQKHKAVAAPKSEGDSGSSNPNVDVARALANKFPPDQFTYSERDVVLYALAIGAGANPLDDKELQYVYESHANFQVLPTFGVIVPSASMAQVGGADGLSFNPMMMLHGEQYLEVRKPLPPAATLTNHAKISGVYDKGKGALVIMDVTTKDDKGEDVLFNQCSLFIRGLGGFGGDKGPTPPSYDPPTRPPDVVHREATLDNQAALYRLCGDRNPLHIDPNMASMGGFDRPILHGLCSFGYASRAVIKHFCGNDASRFKSIRVRFVKHVFPGETLITEMWQTSPTLVVFRVKSAERGEYVLSNCAVELHPLPGTGAASGNASKEAGKAKAADAAAAAGSAFQAEAVFEALKSRASPDIVKKVGGTYRFDVTKDSEKRSWLVDLKNGSGSVTEVKQDAKADCVIGIKDGDFVALMNGKLNPQSAFMKKQLTIKGNLMLATKLSVLTGQTSSL